MNAKEKKCAPQKITIKIQLIKTVYLFSRKFATYTES